MWNILALTFCCFFHFLLQNLYPFFFFLSRRLFLFQLLCNLIDLVYSFPFIFVPNSPSLSPPVPPSYFSIPNPLPIHSLTPLMFYLLCSSLSLIFLCSYSRTFFSISIHYRVFSFLLVTLLLQCPDSHVVPWNVWPTLEGFPGHAKRTALCSIE
jgi:hypothetical protein